MKHTFSLVAFLLVLQFSFAQNSEGLDNRETVSTGGASSQIANLAFMKKILQFDADKPISAVGLELSKDPSLLGRIIIFNSKSGYQYLNFEGGIKLSNGITNLFSSGNWQNPNWTANLNFIFAPKKFLITKFYTKDVNMFRDTTKGPNKTISAMDKSKASQRIYWWFSLKAGFDQTNNTLLNPLASSFGDPTYDISNKTVNSLAFSPSINLHFYPSRRLLTNLNIFAKLNYTLKPKDNNFADLADFTLAQNTIIEDTVNRVSYTILKNQQTGKTGKYMESVSHALLLNGTFVFGKKQNYAVNFNFNYITKETAKSLIGELGIYVPFKVADSDDNPKYASLGFIIRTKDLLKSYTTSLDKNITIGLKVGFPL